MRVNEGTEPVADDELLYRRVPAASGWYSPQTGLERDAFAPHRTQDVTGISVDRAKYKSVMEAGAGRPGKSYYVAVLRAGDVRSQGIEIVPRPEPGNPAHAELPALNAANRKSTRTRELQEMLVSLTLRVEGPFPPATEVTL